MEHLDLGEKQCILNLKKPIYYLDHNSTSVKETYPFFCLHHKYLLCCIKFSTVKNFVWNILKAIATSTISLTSLFVRYLSDKSPIPFTEKKIIPTWMKEQIK